MMENIQSRYDFEGLAKELEIDIPLLARLFRNYFTEMASETVEMENMFHNKNWVGLERVIHNIKGVSANLSIHDVYQEAALLDERLKKNMVDDVKIYIDKIDKLIAGAKDEVQKFLSQNGHGL
ncbi:MAG: hypothetical protein N2645_18090 [Clostridia bacterium]|nr:hypothetical protein [Clostridia bacterium]